MALYKLGDVGVIADVHCFRISYLKLKGLKTTNDTIEWLSRALQVEQMWHNDNIQKFIRELDEIKKHLANAYVRD